VTSDVKLGVETLGIELDIEAADVAAGVEVISVATDCSAANEALDSDVLSDIDKPDVSDSDMTLLLKI